ncbi:MAG: hypothetical protein ACXAC5_24610 [Promethearchaeota archaeon]|jgi:hypothetical protein
MSSEEELKEKTFWEKKIKEHWSVLVVCIIAVIAAFIGAVVVLIRFIETSPIGAQGTALVGDWNLDWIVGFIILVTLWELLLVGVPCALFFGLGGYLVWRRLPEEEKQEFKAREKKKTRRKETAGGSGGFSCVIFIGYCLYHGIKGTYFTSFGSVYYSYWIFTWFETIMWFFIVLGLPVVIILIIVYFAVWRKKSE